MLLFPGCLLSLTLLGVRAGFTGGSGAGLLNGFVLRGGGLGVFETLPVVEDNRSSIESSRKQKHTNQKLF